MKATVAKGFSSVMAQRREPPSSLEFFPTSRWATRALFVHVMPIIDAERPVSIWELAAAADVANCHRNCHRTTRQGLKPSGTRKHSEAQITQ